MIVIRVVTRICHWRCPYRILQINYADVGLASGARNQLRLLKIQWNIDATKGQGTSKT